MDEKAITYNPKAVGEHKRVGQQEKPGRPTAAAARR